MGLVWFGTMMAQEAEANGQRGVKGQGEGSGKDSAPPADLENAPSPHT